MSKFLLGSVFVLSLSASAFADSVCPSVDGVINAAKQGRIQFDSPFDFSFSSAIAWATVCQIETLPNKTAMCDSRIGLWKQIVKAGDAAFTVGEATRSDVASAKKHLADTLSECGQ